LGPVTYWRAWQLATACLKAHRVTVKKKRKGTDKQKKGPAKKSKASRSPKGKQQQERRNGWDTKRRHVRGRPHPPFPIDRSGAHGGSWSGAAPAWANAVLPFPMRGEERCMDAF
ncbi:hypothetical protein HaLaN_19462, partial [Haematococcus lacustris]